MPEEPASYDLLRRIITENIPADIACEWCQDPGSAEYGIQPLDASNEDGHVNYFSCTGHLDSVMTEHNVVLAIVWLLDRSGTTPG